MSKKQFVAVVNTTQTGLTSTNGNTMTLASATGFPPAPFLAVVEPGGNAETVLVGTLVGTAASNITRGYDGSLPATHPSGCVVTPDPVGVDTNQSILPAGRVAITGSISATVAGGTQTIATANVYIPVCVGLVKVLWSIEVATTENTTFYQCTIGGVAATNSNKRATTGSVASTANQVSPYFVYLMAPPTGTAVPVVLTCSSVQTAGVIAANGIVELAP